MENTVNIIERIQEPSTWAGLAVLVAVASPALAESVPAIGEAVGGIIAGVLAIIAIFRKDPGSPE